MSYIKAEDVLPRDLIERIQEYIDGESIYIPRRAENRRRWGQDTDYRDYLRRRNAAIRADHRMGIKVAVLSARYHLTDKSIRRILATEEPMEIIDYFASDRQPWLLEAIRQARWSAADFLAGLLEQGTFDETLGGWGTVYLLTEGEQVVSFLTLAGQDSVRDESLTPWAGFVYTFPHARGRRLAGKLLSHAEKMARERGYQRLYIATDYVGLYESYGYCYLEHRTDCWGDEMRVLYKAL